MCACWKQIDDLWVLCTTGHFKNALILFSDPQNLAVDTWFVMFACIVAEILEKNDLSVMAATNLDIYEYCVLLITSEMS